MSLRHVSGIALAALVFSVGLHAGLWLRTETRTSAQATSAPPEESTSLLQFALSDDSRDWPPEVDLGSSSSIPVELAVNTEALSGNNVDIDLHPPIVALHRVENAVGAKLSTIDESRLHPPELIPVPAPQHSIIQIEGPAFPPATAPAQEQRTAEVDIPERLPSAPQAAPLTNAPAEKPVPDAVRKLLEKELPDASPEERKVWAEELRGLPPSAIRDLFHLRRQVRDLESSEGAGEPAAPILPPRTASRPDRLPAPAWPRRLPDIESGVPHESYSTLPPYPVDDDTATVESTLAAVRQARAIVLNNLANARTPGYRRVIVTFSELPGPVELGDAASVDSVHIAGIGIRMGTSRVDMATPGPAIVTKEPLDLTIVGPGLFEVALNGQRRFTRNGRLTLDAQRRLCVRCGAATSALQPEVTLPEDAAAVRISEAGLVEVQRGGSEEWTSVGTISLARFLNPSELRPCGFALFAATIASGAPQRLAPGTAGCALRSGCLEGSNVRVKAERQEIEKLEDLIETVLQAAEMTLPMDEAAGAMSTAGPTCLGTCPLATEPASAEIDPPRNGTCPGEGRCCDGSRCAGESCCPANEECPDNE